MSTQTHPKGAGRRKRRQRRSRGQTKAVSDLVPASPTAVAGAPAPCTRLPQPSEPPSPGTADVHVVHPYAASVTNVRNDSRDQARDVHRALLPCSDARAGLCGTCTSLCPPTEASQRCEWGELQQCETAFAGDGLPFLAVKEFHRSAAGVSMHPSDVRMCSRARLLGVGREGCCLMWSHRLWVVSTDSNCPYADAHSGSLAVKRVLACEDFFP